jgi:hypothetical protein
MSKARKTTKIRREQKARKARRVSGATRQRSHQKERDMNQHVQTLDTFSPFSTKARKSISRRKQKTAVVGPEPVSASLRMDDNSPRAALARVQRVMNCLQKRYVCKDWVADKSGCERTLNYFRRAAAAGTWTDSGDMPDQQFAMDFLYRHGQSMDWVFGGNPGVMICREASRS